MNALFLFDFTTIMAQPWAEAGYDCYCVDIQHPQGTSREGNIVRVGHDVERFGRVFMPDGPIAFVAAFPPCTDVAVSGARWFRDKGLGALIDALTLFKAAIGICESSGAPYMIENPVSTVSTYWRKPDFIFHPYQYTGFCKDDNYTKKTCLWVGNGFVMPEPFVDENLGPPDDRIHKAAPGDERANFRSATPRGFARAVFNANHVHEAACA